MKLFSFLDPLFGGQLLAGRVRASANSDHPNEDGRWTRLQNSNDVTLWKRERETPPVTQFYIIAPARQHEIVYDETKAVQRSNTLSTEQTETPKKRVNPS